MPIDSFLDGTLNEKVKSYLEDFFVSLQNDNIPLESFLGTFSTFNNTFHKHRGKLQEETLNAVQKFSSVVHTVASNILDLEVINEQLGQDNVEDISMILSSSMTTMSINDDLPRSNGNAPFPAYIRPSYAWLIDNLHNPYPSKEQKKSISRQTQCSLKDIDAWFIDTRKRIGWNSLRKKLFGNKQEKIIAAATQHFKPTISSFKDDLTTSLISEMDQTDHYRSEFVLIQTRARGLYSNRFPDLAASLPSMTYLSSITLADSVNSKLETVFKPSDYISTSNTETPIPYPTPEPSPSSSNDLPENVPVANILPGNARKRRQSFSDSSDCETHAAKRSRLTESTSVASITSPPAAIVVLGDIPANSPSNASTIIAAKSLVSGTSTLKRKRRLSNEEGHCPPKRPHNSLCYLRLQTVSDPFPIAKPDDSVNGWGQDNTNPLSEYHLSDTIPLPVNAEDSPWATYLNLDAEQPDLPLVNPGVFLSDTFANDDLGNVSQSIFSLGNSNFSVAEEQSFTDVLRDVGLDLTSNLQFELVPAPSYRFDFVGDKLNPVVDLTCLERPAQFSDYTPDTSSVLGADYSLNSLDSVPMTYVKTSILGNSNRPSRQDLLSNKEQQAKRARAQALREELAQLAAEGL